MRVVLDTDVVVAALRSPAGASRRVLAAAADREVELAASVPLMVEWEAVLKRPAMLAATGLSAEDVDVVLDQLAAVLVPVEPHYMWRPQLPDPADEMVLETAINGGAAIIGTFNVRHLERAAARFGIEALRPGELLRRLKT